MLFRDKFLLSTGMPFGEEPSNWIAKVTEGGFRVSLDMRKAQMRLLKAGFEHVAQTQAAASAALQGEITYQIDRLNRQILQSSSDIVAAEERSAAEIVNAIQQMCDYLGAGLLEVRWAVERHTKVSKQTLEVLLNSHAHNSRQFFEDGVKWFEAKEYGLAKNDFAKALEAKSTNHFAYQYLGFIAVEENNADEAIRCFELARKSADETYYKALALSNLAHTYQSIDQLPKAAELAESATAIYTQKAKFWYEFAGYSARLGRNEEAIKALKEAIERDWMFFTIVAGDHDFDSIRVNVNRLLDSTRERERGKARQSLDNLRQAISTTQKSGADKELESYRKTLTELESKYKQNNVFLYREIVPKAEELHGKLFQIAEQSLSKRIEEKRRAIQRNESDRSTQISSLCSTLNNLDSQIHRFDSKSKEKFDLTLYIFGYIILFVALFLGSCFTISLATHVREGRQVVLSQAFMVALFGPILLIGGYKFLEHLFTKAIPRQSLERKRNDEAAKVGPKKKQLEESFNRTHKALEKELAALETFLAKCKAKQYV